MASWVNLAPATETAEIVQNVRTIIETPSGSCPMYREFGVSSDAIDMPVARAAEMLRQEYFARIEEFEPRVSVESVEFEADNDGRLQPTITVRIKETGAEVTIQ